MMQAISDAEKVKPFAEVNGIPVVDFEGYNDLTARDYYMKSAPGIVPVDDRGFPTKTPTPYLAMNPDVMFMNRYRVVKEKGRAILQVVIDRRAILDQPRGTIYKAQIPAICLYRDESGELRYDKTVLVSDKEFIADFINHLTNEAMREIAPLMNGEDPTANSIPI